MSLSWPLSPVFISAFPRNVLLPFAVQHNETTISNRQPPSLERLDVFGCNVAKVAKIRSGFENVQHVCLMHYFHTSCVDQSATLGHLWQQVLQENHRKNMACSEVIILHVSLITADKYWRIHRWFRKTRQPHAVTACCSVYKSKYMKI